MTDAPHDGLRLDVWLDVACLFKTRSEARRACMGGKVAVGGVRAKPHRTIRVGEEVVITRPRGLRQQVVVRGLVDQHVPKEQARELYEDHTPPRSPEEAEMWRLGLVGREARAPGKRQRRELRRLKGRDL